MAEGLHEEGVLRSHGVRPCPVPLCVAVLVGNSKGTGTTIRLRGLIHVRLTRLSCGRPDMAAPTDRFEQVDLKEVSCVVVPAVDARGMEELAQCSSLGALLTKVHGHHTSDVTSDGRNRHCVCADGDGIGAGGWDRCSTRKFPCA